MSDSIVESKKPPFAIFLDIDGVLNRNDQRQVVRTARKYFPGLRNLPRDFLACSIAEVSLFSARAIENLDKIIAKISVSHSVWIVISSNWRRRLSVQGLKYLFANYKFSKYIVGKTVNKVRNLNKFCTQDHKHGHCRAAEINLWLNNHPEVLNSFFVMDDIDDHLDINFGRRFVKTESSKLLTTEISAMVQTLFANNFNATIAEVPSSSKEKTILDKKLKELSKGGPRGITKKQFWQQKHPTPL
jgi:hypothetical protein